MLPDDTAITWGLAAALAAFLVFGATGAWWFSRVIGKLKSSLAESFEAGLKELSNHVDKAIVDERKDVAARFDKVSTRLDILQKNHADLQVDIARSYASKDGVRDGIMRVEESIGEVRKMLEHITIRVDGLKDGK